MDLQGLKLHVNCIVSYIVIKACIFSVWGTEDDTLVLKHIAQLVKTYKIYVVWLWI
jgi:hypothetical protein